MRPLPSSYPQALWGQEKQRALLQSLLARDTDSMAGLSVLYNPCPSRGSETVLTSVLRHVTRDVPPAPADVAALLLRMANAEPVTDVASQALL